MKKICLLLLILLCFLAGCQDLHIPSFKTSSGMLELHSIDVGQGDSTLILSPGGRTMLIDAGDNAHADEVVSYLKTKGISHIDILIGTHPDADHIGGIDAVIDEFPVGTFFMSSHKSKSKSYRDVLRAAKEKDLPIQTVVAGMKIDFDKEMEAFFLSPFDHAYMSSNQFSAVTYLRYKKNRFLLMGDAEAVNEEEILKHYPDLRCDYLKIGHHGSKHSTTDIFLRTVRPRVAIISCGYKNSFFHPHKRVMELLKKNGILVYRTDEQKDLIFFSDGIDLYTDMPSPGSYNYPK